MAKMTVYVPDELKQRMDEVDGVNWSPLACAAFEAELSKTNHTRKARTMKELASRWNEVSGETARERLVRNGIEQVEWRYVKYLEDMGKEPAVFVLNLLDEFGREFAEGHIGKESVARQIEKYDLEHATPVFFFLCGLENAAKLMGTGEFEMFGDVPGIPVPPENLLIVGISHGGMLLRWFPKPTVS